LYYDKLTNHSLQARLMLPIATRYLLLVSLTFYQPTCCPCMLV